MLATVYRHTGRLTKGAVLATFKPDGRYHSGIGKHSVEFDGYYYSSMHNKFRYRADGIFVWDQNFYHNRIIEKHKIMFTGVGDNSDAYNYSIVQVE
jgi:hypothetical protein